MSCSHLVKWPDLFWWSDRKSTFWWYHFYFFCITNAKAWKPRKSRLESPTKPGSPPTRDTKKKIFLNLANLGWKLGRTWKIQANNHRRVEKNMFLEWGETTFVPNHRASTYWNTLIPCLFHVLPRFQLKLARFRKICFLMSLVGKLPGFVGLSNLDFRGFQAFAFFIQ